MLLSFCGYISVGWILVFSVFDTLNILFWYHIFHFYQYSSFWYCVHYVFLPIDHHLNHWIDTFAKPPFPRVVLDTSFLRMNFSLILILCLAVAQSRNSYFDTCYRYSLNSTVWSRIGSFHSWFQSCPTTSCIWTVKGSRWIAMWCSISLVFIHRIRICRTTSSLILWCFIME